MTISNVDLIQYEKKSKLGLKYVKEGEKVCVYNPLGEKIAELNLEFASQKIYNDSWFGFVTGDEFKEVMSGAYLDYFAKTNCTKKVCNTLSLQGGMDEETSKWFGESLLPQLLKAGMAYNALVIPEDIFAQQSMEEFEANLGNKLGRLFPSFQKALEWLQNEN